MVVMMAIYGNNSCSVLQLDIASGGGGGGGRRRRRLHCIRVLGLVLFCRPLTAKLLNEAALSQTIQRLRRKESKAHSCCQ